MILTFPSITEHVLTYQKLHMKGFIFLLAFIVSSNLMGQTKAKNAYKQFSKGDYEKANELLSEVKAEDIRLEFYYVRSLCNLQSANSKEVYFSIYEDLLKGNPELEKDPKELEDLFKSFDLNTASYEAAKDNFFKSAFNFYKGLDQTESWKDHNAKYASSPFLTEGYNLESLAALKDALANGGNPQKLKSVYEDYENMEASKKAYDAWGELEFKAAVALNNTKALRTFSESFEAHNRSEEAFSMARAMDYKVAMVDLSIPSLEKFIGIYEDGEEHTAVFNALDSLYHKDLMLNFKDVAFEAYSKKFTEGARRLQLDSLFNTLLYNKLTEGNWEYVQEWNKKIKRNATSFGYEQVKRLSENLEVTVLPFLNDRNNYSLGTLSGKPLTGEAANFKAKTIFRDGNSLFRYQVGEKWGILYLDSQGKIQQLTQAIYDDISGLTKQVYQVTITKPGGNNLSGSLNVLGEYSVPLDAYELLTTLDNGNILVGKGTNYSLIHPFYGKMQSFTTKTAVADGVLAEYDEKEIIRSIYTLSGKPLGKGTSISVKNFYETVNVKIDGKSFLVLNDSLVPSPSTELIAFYLDSKNYISSKNSDEQKYSITASGVKGIELNCDIMYVLDEVVIFNLAAGGHKLVSKRNFSESLTNLTTFSDLGGVYLTSNPSGNVQLIVPNQGKLTTAPLPFVNTPEYGDEYYGDGGMMEGGDEPDMFWINDSEVPYHEISNPKSPFVWTEEHTALVAVEIGQSYGYVNLSGELKIPSQYNYAQQFNGWTAQVSDEEGNQFIIDPDGNQIAEGYLSKWVNSTTFLYNKGGKVFEYTSPKQSAENGRITEICSSCSIRQVIAPGIYEVDLDDFTGYVTKKNNQGQFLGEYLKSSYRKFKLDYAKLISDYWSTENDFYEVNRLIDELDTPKELKYAMAIVKFNVAINLDHYDFSSILTELESYNEFNLEEKESIYFQLTSHFYNKDDYSQTATYLNDLKLIVDYDRFIQQYGLMAGYTYRKLYDRSEAKKIYTSYISYDEVSAHDNLGDIYFEERDFDMAIKSWNNALAAAKRLNNEYYWSNGNVFLNLGAAFANQNNKAQMCQNYRAGMGFGNEEATRRYNAQCK
jgi:hypothetical protein